MDYLCKSFHLMIICIRNRRRIWTIHPCWYICHCRTFHSVHIRPCRRKTVRRPSWKILLRKHTRKSQQRFHSDRSNKYADFQRIRPKIYSTTITHFYQCQCQIVICFTYQNKSVQMEKGRILLDIDTWRSHPCWCKFHGRTFPSLRTRRDLKTKQNKHKFEWIKRYLHLISNNQIIPKHCLPSELRSKPGGLGWIVCGPAGDDGHRFEWPPHSSVEFP